MAGVTMQVIPKTDYDMTNVGTSAVVVTIERRIVTETWREATAVLRLHSATWSAGAKIELLWQIDGFSQDDPGAIWTNPNGGGTAITMLQSTDTPPTVRAATLAAPFRPLVLFQLRFTNVGVGTAFKPSLSCDLNLQGE